MTRVIVLRWPERDAALLEARWGRTRILETRAAAQPLPREWLDASDEMRVIVGSGLILRSIPLEGLTGHELLEAARFEAEPSLPLPFSSLALTSFENGRAGRVRHVIVAAIASSTLDEIRAWATSLTADSAEPLPISWIGPALAALHPDSGEALIGAGWAAIEGDKRWLHIQTAASGNAAADAITRDKRLDPHPSWKPSDAAREYAAVLSARDRGSWITTTAAARSQATRRHWPLGLAAASLLLLAAAFGARYAAAGRRIDIARAAAVETYTTAVPGGRAVAPREQLKARMTETRRTFSMLRARVEKESSALDLLALLEEAAGRLGETPTSTFRVDDLRITVRDFTVSGSASSVEIVQKLVQDLRTPREGSSEPPHTVAEPEVRRAQAGLGFDFTVRGVR